LELPRGQKQLSIAAQNAVTVLDFGRLGPRKRSDGAPAPPVTRITASAASLGNLNCKQKIIPPTMVGLPDPDVPAGVVSWVRDRHEAGATLVSLCSGAFTLAATGLVDGKSVATHRIHEGRRSRR